MFANAIDYVGQFTRPIKFVVRKYKNDELIPYTATLFFVNDEGYALTCKHFAQSILNSLTINENFETFKKRKEALQVDGCTEEKIIELEKEYHLKNHEPIQIIYQFPNCVDSFKEIQVTFSDEYDLALLKFDGFNKILYQGNAVFAKNSTFVRPGHMLCRIGYPFPEFSDYGYDKATDSIHWLEQFSDTPRFPIDGMFTRYVAGKHGEIMGIEISTPGLMGQSGGPLFTSDGIICGMQFETKHYHLGFDMKDVHMNIDGWDKMINNQPFLHVGRCIHVDIIKQFLDDNKVRYYIGDDLEHEEKVNGN